MRLSKEAVIELFTDQCGSMVNSPIRSTRPIAIEAPSALYTSLALRQAIWRKRIPAGSRVGHPSPPSLSGANQS